MWSTPLATQQTPGLLIGIGIAAAVVIIVGGVGMVRMAWRFFRGDEEMEAGGSWGAQLTKPNDDKGHFRKGRR
jgi:hypothetical protein